MVDIGPDREQDMSDGARGTGLEDSLAADNPEGSCAVDNPEGSRAVDNPGVESPVEDSPEGEENLELDIHDKEPVDHSTNGEGRSYDVAVGSNLAGSVGVWNLHRVSIGEEGPHVHESHTPTVARLWSLSSTTYYPLIHGRGFVGYAVLVDSEEDFCFDQGEIVDSTH
jgi:hypothetical protein